MPTTPPLLPTTEITLVDCDAGMYPRLAVSLGKYRLSGAITCTARFTPVGLTEAQWLTLVNIDGAGATVPGASLASSTTLTISSGVNFPRFRLFNAGIKDIGLAFGEGHRLQELVFVNKRTWTTGVANPLFSVDIQAA